MHAAVEPAPPANIEAEAALLGALMLDNRIAEDVQLKLRPEHFFEPLHGRIYEVILKLLDRNMLATPVTLRPMFEGDAGMRELGGPAYLAQLTGSGAALIGARDFANQIYDLALLRVLVGVGREMVDTALDTSEDVDPQQQIARATTALDQISERGDPLHQPSGAQCLDELIEGFDKPVTGTLCRSIPALDRLLGPLAPKQLVIGAARPGMGKTALGISYSLGAAAQGHGVLFVSLEMSSGELAQRMAADLCFGRDAGIPFQAIRDQRLSDRQRQDICRARERLADMPFQVVDAGSLSIGRLATIVRRYKRRFAAKGRSLDLVIVDYLQLIGSDNKGRSPYETVSEVSRGLKAIAKDQSVAMFALAQLSREVEKRPDKRPQLSDLRDSGQIEQDADKVLFLFRAEYYLRQNEPEQGAADRLKWEEAIEQSRNRIEFILAKRRNGRTGTADGWFYGEYQAMRS